MFKLIKQLFTLLTTSQRKRFYVVQILVVLMAFAETAAVASIAPFMAMVGNMSLLDANNHGILGKIYLASGCSSPRDFLFWTGFGSISVIAVGELLSIYTIWRLSLFASNVGIEIADSLYKYYVTKPWLFHASGNSAELTNNISSEAFRVSEQIINPLLQMNARVVLAVILSVAIFIYNPMILLIGLLIFLLAYLFLYKLVRQRLINNGEMMSEMSTTRFKLMAEGFGGIKDVLLLGCSKQFIDQFYLSGKKFAYARGSNSALAQIPRYFLELVAFGAVIILVLYLVKNYEGNLSAVLPILAIYALAGFKLLPAFQVIFSSVAQIKGGIPAFEALKKDLQAADEQNNNENFKVEMEQRESAHLMPFNHAITIKNVTFTYPGKQQPALKKLNLTIPVNKTIGLVGSSGSGKSTAIDLLLGLIQPCEGQLLIDGQVMDAMKLRSWQNTLGFVPQSIFLADASIAENVAFGLPVEKIDREKVMSAIKLAHLDELVNQLPEGLFTRVGERGIQLSGGQRQRIGIARSLYYDAQTLILDEATSALDGITEKLIMDAIHDFAGNKTIIMIAHRLATVKKCDVIYLLEKGSVVAQGTYNELIQKDPTFKKMVLHA